MRSTQRAPRLPNWQITLSSMARSRLLG